MDRPDAVFTNREFHIAEISGESPGRGGGESRVSCRHDTALAQPLNEIRKQTLVGNDDLVARQSVYAAGKFERRVPDVGFRFFRRMRLGAAARDASAPVVLVFLFARLVAAGPVSGPPWVITTRTRIVATISATTAATSSATSSATAATAISSSARWAGDACRQWTGNWIDRQSSGGPWPRREHPIEPSLRQVLLVPGRWVVRTASRRQRRRPRHVADVFSFLVANRHRV